jgi:hypothetical protein
MRQALTHKDHEVEKKQLLVRRGQKWMLAAMLAHGQML